MVYKVKWYKEQEGEWQNANKNSTSILILYIFDLIYTQQHGPEFLRHRRRNIKFLKIKFLQDDAGINKPVKRAVAFNKI